ncbi:MAG: methyl-accepting chemotaxis protein [Chamaesiphon sp.]|nr:methyl-accepting chemotaxis protein [Chamaesiphon sp.]
MNSNQTASLTSQRQSPIQQIRSLVRSNLVGTITATVAGSLLLTGVSTWGIWTIYTSFQSTVAKQFELQKTSAEIVYQDEFLTMSAKMLVSTGDLQWETRYNQMLPKADASLKKFLANISAEQKIKASKNDGASAKLFELEDKAFKLVKQGKQKEAYQVLMGGEYAAQKKIFGDGNSAVLADVDRSIQTELNDYQQQLIFAIVIAVASLPILLASWTLVLLAVRDYIRDRQIAQAEIEKSQQNLLTSNQALEVESQNRQQQEEIVREERDILQQDIGELLDVVCDIEAGDFTVSANVNERATGLIGDVLNRLVEGLGLLLSQVSIEAQQVAANSHLQDKIAATVARSSSEQTESVNQVLALTQTVRQSANDAATQLAATDRSLGSLQTAVTDGEITIESLDLSIDVLQQGSDRIVQQMKALGEFVGLSDRFVDDQTDIATQTQILALNASLVAARAAEQRDPRQFEAVAREFESIAGQVSQLAQQTNEGLASLEQRNSQIHRVVSDVDGEVQRLGSLVNSFTLGVKQTREVFATVQSVTGQVVKAGEVVSQTSQTIINSADSTARSISAIATLSAQIDAQSQTARSISTKMNELSAGLISNIQVFKLPAQKSMVSLPMITVATPEPLSMPDLEPILAEQSHQFN